METNLATPSDGRMSFFWVDSTNSWCHSLFWKESWWRSVHFLLKINTTNTWRVIKFHRCKRIIKLGIYNSGRNTSQAAIGQIEKRRGKKRSSQRKTWSWSSTTGINLSLFCRSPMTFKNMPFTSLSPGKTGGGYCLYFGGAPKQVPKTRNIKKSKQYRQTEF